MRSPSDHASALRFALRTPGVVATELEQLMTSNGESMTVPATRDVAAARRRANVALGWLSLLSRTWGTPWRNTCLFRSVTECMVLRAHGFRARVVIGVARGGDVTTGRSVMAHAWVECAGIVCACEAGERTYHALLPAVAG